MAGEQEIPPQEAFSSPPAQEPPSARVGVGERVRILVAVVLTVLIVLFAVLNTREVKVDWIFGSGHAPLIVVILISLLVGGVFTYIGERFSRRRRKG